MCTGWPCSILVVTFGSSRIIVKKVLDKLVISLTSAVTKRDYLLPPEVEANSNSHLDLIKIDNGQFQKWKVVKYIIKGLIY